MATYIECELCHKGHYSGKKRPVLRCSNEKCTDLRIRMNENLKELKTAMRNQREKELLQMNNFISAEQIIEREKELLKKKKTGYFGWFNTYRKKKLFDKTCSICKRTERVPAYALQSKICDKEECRLARQEKIKRSVGVYYLEHGKSPSVKQIKKLLA